MGKSKIRMPDIKHALRNQMTNQLNLSVESEAAEQKKSLAVSARASTAAAGTNYR